MLSSLIDDVYQVRCSGERTGCRRCRNIDQACEYSVSRVGKASSNRIKNRGLLNTNAKGSVESLEGSVMGSSTRESSVTSAPKAPNGNNDVLMNWSNGDAQNEPFSCPNSPWDGGNSLSWQYAASTTDSDFLMPLPTDLELDSLGLNIKHGLLTPPVSSDSTDFASRIQDFTAVRKDEENVVAILPNSGEQDGYRDRPSLLDRCAIMNGKDITSTASRSSQWISRCTKLIDFLEKRLRNNPIALDEFLRVSKVSVGEIESIINSDACKESTNCLLLVSVAMNQITSLFEANIRSDDVLLGVRSMMPSLVFGSFQVDQEEQIAFWTRIVGKEIGRYRQVLGQLSATLQQFPAHLTQGVGLNKQWFTSTAWRLDALIAVVEEQR